MSKERVHVFRRRPSDYTRAKQAEALPRALEMQQQRDQGKSLQEIADHYGISRQRVWQILRRLERSSGGAS